MKQGKTAKTGARQRLRLRNSTGPPRNASNQSAAEKTVAK